MTTNDMTDAYDWNGRTVVGSDGEKIGKVDQVYLDTASGQPEWLAIHTGLFGTKTNFVPLEGAAPNGEDVRVAYTKDQVKDAPGIDPDGELSDEEERSLWSHYGLDYDSGHDAGTVDTDRAVVGNDVSGPETDEAMTRSEEELAVGTREREGGRARLRKYVVTENVTQTVPVRKEKAVLETEPITDANVGRRHLGPRHLRGGARGHALRGGGRGREEGGAEGARAARQGDRGLRAGGLRGGPQGADRDRGCNQALIDRRARAWPGLSTRGDELRHPTPCR
ncbi:MAG: PRC and DUF2382 domain-containing protein [Solirubrobacterales bacterium]